MYSRYFNLKKKPFQINPDNRFLWWGKGHERALSSLKKGLTEKQGLMILTGDAGTGKTTLINEIIQSLPPETRTVRIEDPEFELNLLFQAIVRGLGSETLHPSDKIFSSQLCSLQKKQVRPLVIIDESQRIPRRMFEKIIAWDRRGLPLHVILSGQLEFIHILKENLGPTWRDHVLVHASLTPLTREETGRYIQKRLEIAGTGQVIFQPSAIRAAHAFSEGFPRLINTSCDQAMIQAFADDLKQIDDHTFNKALKALRLPGPQKRRPHRPEQAHNPLPIPRPSPHAQKAAKKSSLIQKAAAGLLATCFWLYPADLFFNEPANSPKIHPMPKTQPIKEHMGLGYTPAPELAAKPAPLEPRNHHQGKPGPSMETNISPADLPAPARNEDSPPILPSVKPPLNESSPEPEKPVQAPLQAEQPVKNTVQTMDKFLQQVFLLEKRDALFMGTGTEPVPAAQDRKPEKKPMAGEPPRFRKKGGVQPPEEPDPSAVIDWILKKKNRN